MKMYATENIREYEKTAQKNNDDEPEREETTVSRQMKNPHCGQAVHGCTPGTSESHRPIRTLTAEMRKFPSKL